MRVRSGIQIEIRNIEANCRFYKTSVYLSAYNWTTKPDDAKLSNNVNTFKHKVKKRFLTLLREKDQDIYAYYGQITAIITLF